MNSGRWLQGPKIDCIIFKEGLLWSEDDYIDDDLRNFNKGWCCDRWSMWANWKFSHRLDPKRIRDGKLCVTWEPYMGNQTLKLELTRKMSKIHLIEEKSTLIDWFIGYSKSFLKIWSHFYVSVIEVQHT